MAKDCGPPIRERVNLGLITLGCWLMAFLRRQRRPGSRIAGALAVALPIAATAKDQKWLASFWSTTWGRVSFIALTAVAGVGMYFVAMGYRRALGRDKTSEILAGAVQSLAQLVEQSTSLASGEYNVNIWLVKGMKGFRRLVRGPSFAASHHETPIVWTKGKGIIGQAWGRKRTRHADLDEVRALWPEGAWCEQGREERFRLSWYEFDETRRYRAVLGVPLRVRRFVLFRVRGVIAVDSLVPGKAAELKALEGTPAFSSIRRTCESAFAKDE